MESMFTKAAKAAKGKQEKVVGKIASPTDGNPKYMVFSLRLPAEVYEALRYQSFITRTSMNSIIYRLIEKELASEEWSMKQESGT